ncbi:hypothetical protein CVT26_000569 [Gymnopilus dilepis]|uniref:F-box domain-containing protein n=1 Tax=Gymnopilus dilepis TaxID=231916 RepID=A0A409VH94_9AGAR|nr:hypothetical protein CVT26_000569 [Gymnopilus dilepis]
MTREITSLLSVEDEVLEVVASYLDQRDQAATIRVCWRLHNPSARQLYRHLVVPRHKASNLFSTLTGSKYDYGIHVRTIRYTPVSDLDVRFAHALLCGAIPRIPNLYGLNVHVPQYLAPFLVPILGKGSTVFSPPNLSRCLPALTDLRVHGDIRLLGLVQDCPITTLSITRAMKQSDFDYLIDILEKKGSKNLMIKNLTIALHYSVGLQIATALSRIAITFSILRHLTLRLPATNALDISRLFAETQLFPLLQSLVINDWPGVRPVFPQGQGRTRVLDVQHGHIVQSSSFRPQLNRMSFGNIHWSREVPSNIWVMKEEIHQPNGLTEQLISDVHDNPMMWGDIIYKLPNTI